MLFHFFRKLPAFRGKKRLFRFLHSSSISEFEDGTVVGKYKAKYLLPNLRENLAFEIFVDGIYEQDTHDFLVRMIPKDGVYFDLGANIGSVVIPLLVKRDDITSVCVEASPWVHEYLNKNLLLNELREVTVVNRALYNTDGLVLDFFAPTEKFGKGSFTPHYTKTATKVETITLDSLVRELGISKVDFIKIDIEGYESYAFEGAVELLSSGEAPDILFEFEDWAEKSAKDLKVASAQLMLLEFGYNIYSIDKSGKLKLLSDVVRKGSQMLFASKRKLEL